MMVQKEANKAIREVIKWVKTKKQDPLNGIEEIELILDQVNENSVLAVVSNFVRQELERRVDLILSEPDGIVRETMIKNIPLDL